MRRNRASFFEPIPMLAVVLAILLPSGAGAEDRELARSEAVLLALRRGDAVDGAALITEAERLRVALPETGAEGRLRAGLAVELSWAYRENAEFERAEARAREAIRLGATLVAPRLEADGHNALGGVYWRRGDLGTVWSLWLEALRLREEAGDRAGVAASYSNLGILLDSEGDFPGALEYYQRALAIDREIGSEPAEIASTLNNIGALHEQMGESAAALDYHREALVIREQVGDERDVATSHNNIGSALADLGRLDEARDELERALKMRRETGDRPGEASTLGELAKLERLAGRLDEARAHATAGLALYREIAEPWGEADVSTQLGEIDLASGRPEDALNHFELARSRAEEIGAPLLLAEQWGGRARALEAMGRWQAALDALRREARVREQIAGDASRRRVELLEIRHETQRKELEVVQLRAANATVERALNQARSERQMMLFGAVGLVLFVAGLAWAFRLQRRAAREANAAHERLQALSEQKDHFLRVVAHDLRSPLGNVRWMAGLLRKEASRVDEVTKVAGMIEDVSARLVATTENLLDLDRIETGMVKPQWRRVALDEVVARMVAERQATAARKQQTLAVRKSASASATGWSVETDETLVVQILDNLISNALKFTPAGGTITVSLNDATDRLAVHVADSGPGIPPEARARLFSRFAMVGNAPTAGEGTHGLGLAIAAGLAQTIGALVSHVAEPNPLGGACFAVTFPRRSNGDQTVTDREVGE